MNDDFNTPNAVAGLFDFIKEANPIISEHNYNDQNKYEILAFMEKINGIFKCFDTLQDKKEDDRESKVKALIDERNKYRQEKNWAKADEIKQQILNLGAEIMDNKDGTTSFKLNN